MSRLRRTRVLVRSLVFVDVSVPDTILQDLKSNVLDWVKVNRDLGHLPMFSPLVLYRPLVLHKRAVSLRLSTHQTPLQWFSYLASHFLIDYDNILESTGHLPTK
jgi:hypothetical protein